MCHDEQHRRSFLRATAGSLAAGLLPLGWLAGAQQPETSMPPVLKYFRISNYDSTFERERLKHPFGFKGAATNELWQIATQLTSADGHKAVGLGVQNVLWCDDRVAARTSESGGNAAMYAVTERALQMIKGQQFASPLAMQEAILDELMDYARAITGQADLHKTYALNALVPVDNAAWLIYARVNGITRFDDLIPMNLRGGLSGRHDGVASMPALTYGTSMEVIKGLADQGFFIMKIKIGAPGNQRLMLEKDKAFLKAIHETIGHYQTPYAPNGKMPYYFDANGRYDHKETLLSFLDYAEQIGALDQIVLVEEPFGGRNQESVHEIVERGVYVAADESAHTVEDANDRMDQGYNSIAVKAVAKTMSMTMRVAQAAFERQVPCFCADLTVNPILVDWNKVIAARLPAFPGWEVGMQETNGWQNYSNWPALVGHHAMPEAAWIASKGGIYDTGDDFREKSGGILLDSPYWSTKFED